MTPHYLLILIRWGINAAFWPAVLFIFCAGIVWPWWKSSWGVNIIALEVAIALALISPVISVDFSIHIATNIVLAWVQVAAMWLVGVIIVWRGFLVLSAQLNGAFGTGITGSLRLLELKWLRSRRARKQELSEHDDDRETQPENPG